MRAASPPPAAVPPPPSTSGTVTGAPSEELLRRLTESIGHEIVGYEDVVRALAIALLTESHVLLEGVPGLAKTSLVRAFARSLALGFRRIQFTPDMLPGDILGTTILRSADQSFEFRPGPIFANVVLADEINRAPPKVQSALLEAMQERQVTIEGTTHPLPRPFIVVATQNPIEQEGTYPLPEAELDRFLFRWIMGYPSGDEEVAILKSRGTGAPGGAVPPVVTPGELDALRGPLADVFLADEVYRYITEVVRSTREEPRLLLGASPRASVHFLLAVKGLAFLDGRSYVVPDDVRELAFPVLNHRVILRPEVIGRSGEASELLGPLHQLRRVLRECVESVPVPR